MHVWMRAPRWVCMCTWAPTLSPPPHSQPHPSSPSPRPPTKRHVILRAMTAAGWHPVSCVKHPKFERILPLSGKRQVVTLPSTPSDAIRGVRNSAGMDACALHARCVRVYTCACMLGWAWKWEWEWEWG